MDFRDDPTNNRFVAKDGDRIVGEIVYRVIREDRLLLDHTEVDDAYEGQGVGSQLAEYALEDVRSSGRMIVPDCPFVAGYLERHPEYRDVVDEELTAELRRLS